MEFIMKREATASLSFLSITRTMNSRTENRRSDSTPFQAANNAHGII